MRRYPGFGAAALGGVMLLLVVSCDDGSPDLADDGVPEEELTFLRFPADLQPLAVQDTSFWAVRGEDRELVVRYDFDDDDGGDDGDDDGGDDGDDDGEEFLTFRVGAASLLARPDGTPFEDGDSVEIMVSVDEEGRFLFEFEPSGLTFDPDNPAELEVEYERLQGDLDGDGDIDDDDDDFERTMQLWKQEGPGELWFPVGTIKFEDDDELEGEITSFTGFAVAI